MTLLERVVALESGAMSTSDYREHEPTMVSLSGGGIGLEAPSPLDHDALLVIDLVLLPSNRSMRAIGRVVECRQDDTGGYAIAIEFEHVREDDRDALIQHIVRKQSAALREGRRERSENVA